MAQAVDALAEARGPPVPQHADAAGDTTGAPGPAALQGYDYQELGNLCFLVRVDRTHSDEGSLAYDIGGRERRLKGVEPLGDILP